MVKTLKVTLLTAMVLYAGLCPAGEKKPASQNVQTLMIKSGLDKQLEQIAPMVLADVTQQNEQSHALSQGELEELSSMISRTFDARALKESVQKHIQANLSEADITSALAWLNSPLGARLTKLEENASTPAAYAEMQQMAGKLTGNASRVDLARKLDNAMKATETGVAVALNTQIALIAALTSAADPEKRPSMETIEKEVAKTKGRIRPVVEQSTLLSFLYAYQSVSDADLVKYIDFAKSASGKRYHSVIFEGVTLAVTQAAHVLGNLILQNSNKVSPVNGSRNI
jgi:hypothetical protein